MQDAVRASYDDGPAGGSAQGEENVSQRIVLAPTRTESFWLLRLYRTLLPRTLRSRIARRVSPDLRNRFILRAAAGGPLRRIADRCALLWFRARHRRLVAHASRGLARDAGRVRLAEIRPDVTPLMARRETLELVCDALTAAGVAYFCVRPLDDRESAVGVSAGDRERALTALATACGEAGAYVGDETRAELGGRAWRHAEDAPVVRIVRFYTTPDGRLVLGREYGCAVEFWTRRTTTSSRRGPTASASASPGRPHRTGLRGALHPARPVRQRHGDCTRPARSSPPGWSRTDVPRRRRLHLGRRRRPAAWRRRRARRSTPSASRGYHARRPTTPASSAATSCATRCARCATYAPWVRNIYLVTDDQMPAWLDTRTPASGWSATGRSSAIRACCRPSTRTPSRASCTTSTAWPSTSSTSTTTCSSAGR